MTRLDGGHGLLLKGDGPGGFEVVSSTNPACRFMVNNAEPPLADFDEDGRIDLAVTQNGAETRLFHNERAVPGLRVRLKGPPGNPSGFGAQLRLRNGDSLGPAIEIQGGSGYWAQNSSVAVFQAVKSPSVLEVRWPGGKLTGTPVSPGTKEVEISKK